MAIQQLLSQTPEQLREYCESLGDEDKQNLYKQVVNEAKGKRLRELRQLSKLATAIEKTTDKKLLKPFRGDDNPLNGVEILSFFGKLSKRLVLIMHPSIYVKSLKQLNELDKLLPQMYKELRPKLTSRMRNYAEKELRFSNFLRDNISTFKFLEKAEHGSIKERRKAAIELIRLFMRQPELNLQGDVFLLGLISQYIGSFRNHVKRKVDDFVDLLEKDLEKLESIEEDNKEYREIENKLMDERSKVMNELQCLALSYVVFEETHKHKMVTKSSSTLEAKFPKLTVTAKVK